MDVHILEPPFSVHDMLWCLSPLKPRGNLGVLFLTAAAAPGGLALARSRAAASSDAFVVGAGVVGEGGEDVRITALVLKLRE